MLFKQAANLVKALQDLGERRHDCFAHLLDLAVRI